MPQNKTDNSRYESKYGGNFVSPAQFISEMMCERLAKKQKSDLPFKFWSTPKWKRAFMTNILAANGLLKIYSARAIITALNKSFNVYSLRAPWLDDVIKQEQEKIDSYVEKIEEAPTPSPAQPVNTTEKPRDNFIQNKNNTLNKLRALDG